jgi:DNA-binding HxlR family transcriptional regulator
MFEDKHTFGEFLNSKEGIATNILTDRLKMLENEGYILKFPVPGKARTGYCITDKGIALIPIVIEMISFGVTHGLATQAELTKQIKKDKAGVMKNLAAALKKKYNAAKIM